MDGNSDFPAPNQPTLLAGAAFGPLTCWSCQPWHRDAAVEQGWFSLPAPFVCWGFVGRSEPWQPGAALGTLWSHTQHSPNPLSAKRWHKSLPDG